MKTIYQVEGGSLTFEKNEEASKTIESMISDQVGKIESSMLERGHDSESAECCAMVTKIRLHTLKAIAGAMPSVFELNLTKQGEGMLSI